MLNSKLVFSAVSTTVPGLEIRNAEVKGVTDRGEALRKVMHEMSGFKITHAELLCIGKQDNGDDFKTYTSCYQASHPTVESFEAAVYSPKLSKSAVQA